jgi:hypothetical protein
MSWNIRIWYAERNVRPDGARSWAKGRHLWSEWPLSYNYFRDYDPSTGRYVESDPVGNVLYQDMAAKNLAARGLPKPEIALQMYGTWPELNHLYGYANGNPLSNTDPKGLLGEGSGAGGPQGNGGANGSCGCSDRKCQVICAGVPGGYPLVVCTRWINECGKITRTNIGLYYWAWLLRGFNFCPSLPMQSGACLMN